MFAKISASNLFFYLVVFLIYLKALITDFKIRSNKIKKKIHINNNNKYILYHSSTYIDAPDKNKF